MGRRRSQSRHARPRSACGVLLEMGGNEQAWAGQESFECGRQAAAAGAAGAGASADAGGRRRSGRAGGLQPRLVRRQGRGAGADAGQRPVARRQRGGHSDGGAPADAVAPAIAAVARQPEPHGGGHRRAAGGAGRRAPGRGQCRLGRAGRPTAGGLQVDTQALTRGWTHAEAPRSSTENGRTTVTINQTADRAILNWQTFNVGRDTTVDFRQQAEWAVLNRVNDPAGRPSQIQGRSRRRARC